MEYSSAKVLLEKYFEGETSLIEERQLRTYFTSDEVVPDLAEYAPLFGAFIKAQQLTCDRPIIMPKKKFPLKYVASIAAVAIMGLLIWTQNTQSDTTLSTSYASEEVAILKTKQALGVMSQMITNSTTQLEVVNEFDKASSTLFK